MTHAAPGPVCACCQQHCWPMWATLGNKIYCNGCYSIGCDAKPAECRRPLRDRIAEKVARSLTRDERFTD